MPKGTLDPPRKGYVTPKRVNPGESSPDYSPAYPVEDSPVKDVKEAAEAQSMQERFNKQMAIASRKGGKTRRQRRRKSKKTRKSRYSW